MVRIKPDDWRPVGINSLESTADEVVRSVTNTLVVAGPGAGKTELLAQRAHYLLTTGQCAPPGRILAISFKRDAAKNLRNRVEERCGEMARRFDSLTLDAFSKTLIDRFMGALPDGWRPHPNYEVAVGPMKPDDIRDWISSAGVPEGSDELQPQAWADQKVRQVHDAIAHGASLPYDEPLLDSRLAHLGMAWWRRALDRPGGTPSLTFPMLNRLAAFLLRSNPKIHTALIHTYQYLFLDEFQDTTEPQYDLTSTAFQEADTVVTAVGDSKQRILLWAGAMPDAFQRYTSDFDAKRHDLVMNHRASPALIETLNAIANAVESDTPPAQPSRTQEGGGCVVLEYGDHVQEAEDLAEVIANAIASGIATRDVCVLVKQRPQDMIGHLQRSLQSHGLTLRDESALQDLLSEPVVEIVLDLLNLATRVRSPRAWRRMIDQLAYLLGAVSSEDADEVAREATRLIKSAREAVGELEVRELPGAVLQSIGPGRIRASYRQYATGNYLDDCIARLSAALTADNVPTGPRAAVDYVAGDDIIPAMTIHKSKGLEFNTVIFMGLEDSQWWSFRTQSDEDKRTFFVAFSRALDQVYFTFCDVREERWGTRTQQRENIDSLYSILKSASVPTDDRR